jgi:hypothetical protein
MRREIIIDAGHPESNGHFCVNPCLHFVTTGAKFAKSSPGKCGLMAEKSLLQKYFGPFSDSMYGLYFKQKVC